MTLPEDYSNLPETGLKDVETSTLPDKGFKIAGLRKFNELQENTERQFNTITKTTHE